MLPCSPTICQQAPLPRFRLSYVFFRLFQAVPLLAVFFLFETVTHFVDAFSPFALYHRFRRTGVGGLRLQLLSVARLWVASHCCVGIASSWKPNLFCLDAAVRDTECAYTCPVLHFCEDCRGLRIFPLPVSIVVFVLWCLCSRGVRDGERPARGQPRGGRTGRCRGPNRATAVERTQEGATGHLCPVFLGWCCSVVLLIVVAYSYLHTTQWDEFLRTTLNERAVEHNNMCSRPRDRPLSRFRRPFKSGNSSLE